MRPISRILLATDLSKCADHAMELASQIARQFSAKLTLLHVYFTPVNLGPLGDAYILQLNLVEKLRTDAARALEQLNQRVSAAGVTAEMLAIEGLAADVIVEVAASRGMDLIVMGTHGRTGLPHLLLGSVAERVLRTAPCPVLTARAPATTKP